MSLRRIFLWGSLGFTAILLGLGLYLYNRVADSSFARMYSNASTPADSVGHAAADSVPPAFAEMFNQRYSLDTSAGDGTGRLVADTSYTAVPRPHAVGGRKVVIAVCGVDSRLNERVEHADANHVVTLWLDSGLVDIVAIPRDTPCDAGFPAGSHLNILANVRARKGRDAWLRQVASVAGVAEIDYYVDLGFSQARGLLELLGFGGNSGSALRVLRSRQAFDAGDFQRCFNQAQFMRQMLLANFDKMDGLSGDLMTRGALCLVTTNLTHDALDSIATALRSAGFPKGPASVSVAIKPAYYAKMAVFNFADSSVMGGLLHRIDKRAAAHGITAAHADTALIAFRRQVNALIEHAAADTAHTPVRAVATLRRAFDQRVWWQLPDDGERSRVRRSMGELLATAYTRTGKATEAAVVRDVVRFEEEMRRGARTVGP